MVEPEDEGAVVDNEQYFCLGPVMRTKFRRLGAEKHTHRLGDSSSLGEVYVVTLHVHCLEYECGA